MKLFTNIFVKAITKQNLIAAIFILPGLSLLFYYGHIFMLIMIVSMIIYFKIPDTKFFLFFKNMLGLNMLFIFLLVIILYYTQMLFPEVMNLNQSQVDFLNLYGGHFSGGMLYRTLINGTVAYYLINGVLYLATMTGKRIFVYAIITSVLVVFSFLKWYV